MKRLVEYFLDDVVSFVRDRKIGVEVETQFLDKSRKPITVGVSQAIVRELVVNHGWTISKKKSWLITEIVAPDGDKILYELGRHNIELATSVLSRNEVWRFTQTKLNQLYAVAEHYEAYPFFGPIVKTDENLLVIPDERDAVWLALDGKDALNLLARCSAVQFTIDISPVEAIGYLNVLGSAIDVFLRDYPQDALWRRYIAESPAGYDPSRYGGPLIFRDFEDYCYQLSKHKVVVGSQLVPFEEVSDLDIPLFLRSVWWYFRLKRYGRQLCIEVRPLARKNDSFIWGQFLRVKDLLGF